MPRSVPAPPSTTYRMAPALTAKLVGLALAVVGIAVFAATIALALLDAPLGSVLLIGLLAVFVVAAAGWWVTTRGVVLRLDEVGYRVHFVRGVGVAAARWADVKDAHTAEVAGTPCVVLRLRSGQTTTLPVEALAADRDDVVRDVRSRLLG